MTDLVDRALEVLIGDAMAAQHARHAAAQRLAGYRHEKSVLSEARRVTVARPLPPLDEEAFEVAAEEFARVYHQAFTRRPIVEPVEECHQEATTEGLLAFWATYTEMVTR